MFMYPVSTCRRLNVPIVTSLVFSILTIFELIIYIIADSRTALISMFFIRNLKQKILTVLSYSNVYLLHLHSYINSIFVIRSLILI